MGSFFGRSHIPACGTVVFLLGSALTASAQGTYSVTGELTLTAEVTSGAIAATASANSSHINVATPGLSLPAYADSASSASATSNALTLQMSVDSSVSGDAKASALQPAAASVAASASSASLSLQNTGQTTATYSFDISYALSDAISTHGPLPLVDESASTLKLLVMVNNVTIATVGLDFSSPTAEPYSANYNTSITSLGMISATLPAGDTDQIVISTEAAGVASSVESSTVPEPGSFGLLIGGCIASIAFLQRKRAR